MAQPVNFVNKNTNQLRQGYMGFSWTALFWGPFQLHSGLIGSGL